MASTTVQGNTVTYSQSSYTFNWCVLVEYELTSDNPGNVVYSVKVKLYHIGDNPQSHVGLNSGIVATVKHNNTTLGTNTTSSSITLYAGESNAVEIYSTNITVNKVQSPQIYRINVSATLSNWGSGTSTIEIPLSVGAIARYYLYCYNNDGTDNRRGQTKYHDQNIILFPSSLFTREGYRLVKYNTSADGSGTDYVPGSTYSANQELTLYCQWELIPGHIFAKVSDEWVQII